LRAAVTWSLRHAGLRWPRGGLLLAGALARLTRPLRRGIADEQLAAAFPHLDRRARRVARRRTWEASLKGAVLGPVVQRHGPSLVLPSPALARLPRPLILTSFHVGPVAGLDGLLATLPGEVVALERGWVRAPASYTLLSGNRDSWERARSFSRALVALRRGALVFLTVDAFEPEEYEVARIDVPMLGRKLSLARGAFALARIARAPIVPIVARWRGTAIEVEVGDLIEPSSDEAAMATATAAWIDGYLRGRPGEVSAFMLERLDPPPARR
jgi:lauroyl/myristoyl acyltransferase